MVISMFLEIKGLWANLTVVRERGDLCGLLLG